MLRPEIDLLNKAREFHSPEELVNWMIEKGLYNHSRCRAWAMRRHYEGLTEKGTPKMDALTFTAEEFCVDEQTVSKAVYYNKDL